ncbi:hypothetical protein [Enterococcus gilvus]|uniref:hypothetical protein n=1 Tax=Enterococcus gilvus TaxID=160453 RepID=UPI0028D3C50B|nr:hypothetical protein [Enterococcus gilvus]
MSNQRKLKLLDILMVVLLVFLLGFAFIPVFIHSDGLRPPFAIILLVLILILIGLSTYRYWLAYPEMKGEKAPLFVPKALGLGWSVNPRNPIGLAIIIGVALIVVAAFIPIIW